MINKFSKHLYEIWVFNNYNYKFKKKMILRLSFFSILYFRTLMSYGIMALIQAISTPGFLFWKLYRFSDLLDPSYPLC